MKNDGTLRVQRRASRRLVMVGLTLAAAVVVSGCGVSATAPVPAVGSQNQPHLKGVSPSHSATSTTSTPSLLTDGVWPDSVSWRAGKVALGQAVTTRDSDYAITVMAPATVFLEKKNYQATAKVTVLRTSRAQEDRGFSPQISKSQKVLFTPGRDSDFDIKYGIIDDTPYQVRISCDQDLIEVGQTTSCRLLFNQYNLELYRFTNFCWWINGVDAAAWPSQR